MNMQANVPLPGLDPYEGGKTSGHLYHAGYGLRPFGAQESEYCFAHKTKPMQFLGECQRYVFAGYQVSTHLKGERAHVRLENERLRFEYEKFDQSLIARMAHKDPGVLRDEPCLMGTVTDTNADEFARYISRLQQKGYLVLWQREIDGNRFVSLQKADDRLYASYFDQAKAVHILRDTVSVPMADFDGGETLHLVKPAICQFGLHQAGMVGGVTADCGMLYFVRLCDNSLLVIDGGEYEQATDEAAAEEMRVMHELTGTRPGEPIRIAAWVCTHAHDDHMDGFAKLLRFHHDELQLERVLLNFPEDQLYRRYIAVYEILDRVARYYPRVKFMKAHTGQRFNLGGVTLDVLLTHEDCVGIAGETVARDMNETTTVVRLSLDGAGVLLLGDVHFAAEAVLLRNFSEDTLRVEAVQTAHHLFNPLEKIYRLCGAAYALAPTRRSSARDDNPSWWALRSSVPADHVLFAEEGTDILVAENGKLVHMQHKNAPQLPFDGSAV